MAASGAVLGLHVGPALPQALPPHLLESVDQVTVTSADEGRSGFQVTFVAGRDRATGREDFPPLLDHTFKIGNRVQITGVVGGRTHVLMDGIVTNLQLAPSTEPGGSRLTVTGEDVSVMLDLHEVSLPFPAMPDFAIALMLLAPLAAYGTVPVVVPEPFAAAPLPIDRVPHRDGTFLGIITQMAQKWGYSFYVEAGPVRGMNTAYWGPQVRAGIPQKALTWRMGAASNLGSIQLQSDGTKPKLVYGLVQEERSNAPVPVIGLPYPGSTLSAVPALAGNQPFVGVSRLAAESGGDVLRALWQATGEVFKASKAAVTASGELDVGQYGDVLRARALVDLRGVGRTMDGSWYVQSTTHTIRRGAWTQSFNLEREGTGALSGSVVAV